MPLAYRPTGAFVVVVSGIVAQYGLEGLFMCTLMAGVILVLLGITGLGTAVKYIPRPVVQPDVREPTRDLCRTHYAHACLN